MKKRMLVLSGLLGFGVLFGCSQVSNDVSAAREGEMSIVSVDEVHRGDAVVIKHKITGCYFTYVRGHGSSTSSALTQIFVEKDGVSVPYCEGE